MQLKVYMITNIKGLQTYILLVAHLLKLIIRKQR